MVGYGKKGDPDEQGSKARAHEMRNEMGRADETAQWASVKRSGHSQSKPLQFASSGGAVRLGAREARAGHKMRRKQME